MFYVIRETQIKTIIRYQFIHIRMATIKKKREKIASTGKHTKKLEPSGIAGGNEHDMTAVEKFGGSLKNLTLPYDPAIPILHIDPKEMKAEIQIGTWKVPSLFTLFMGEKPA